MTEKRFNMEYVHGNPTIWHITDCGEHIVDEKICDLLNALHEENEQLKQQLKTKVIVNKQYEELQRLKQENEKLKQQRDFYYARLQKIIKIANGGFE